MENDRQKLRETHLPSLSLGLEKDLSLSEEWPLLKDTMVIGSGPHNVKDKDVLEGHYRLAKIYFDKADLLLAKKYFLFVLKHISGGPWPQMEVKILNFLTRIVSEHRDSQEMQKYISMSSDLLEGLLKKDESSVPMKKEDILNCLSMLEIYKKNPLNALDLCGKALKLAQERGNADITAKAHYSKASAHFYLKEYDRCLEEISLLEDELRGGKRIYLFGAMYLLKGNCLADLGEFQDAQNSYITAQKVLRERKCWNLNLYILLGQGILERRKGEIEKAMHFFKLVQCLVDRKVYHRLRDVVSKQVKEIKDRSIDLYIDKKARLIYEKTLGRIDFKHRFVLMEILFLLAQKPGIYYDKEKLAMEIWGNEYNPLIHDKLIYTSISRLRKLIEPKGGKLKYIIRGKEGYTLNDGVKVRFCREQDLDTFAIGNIEINSPV